MNTEQQALNIEKYKYILTRKQSLNESTFKIATIYQTLLVGLAVSQFKVISMLSAKSIPLEVALLSSKYLVFILGFVTLLALSLLIGGIFSWLDYGREETLINQAKQFKNPKISNILRWYETYISITIAVIFFAALRCYFTELIPLLENISNR